MRASIFRKVLYVRQRNRLPPMIFSFTYGWRVTGEKLTGCQEELLYFEAHRGSSEHLRGHVRPEEPLRENKLNRLRVI